MIRTPAATVLRGDARCLPLPDASVDLVVTSPPYFGLRSYTDGGEHYGGQVGSEATPAEYVAALTECTRDWVRVLKPSGSIFVNLGDKYNSGPGDVGGNSADLPYHLRKGKSAAQNLRGSRARSLGSSLPPKSLLGLPWRYALAVTDQLGLILRAEIIWSKPNGLPESVTDRVRRSHEVVFHFTRLPRYYSAVDEIREPHELSTMDRARYPAAKAFNARNSDGTINGGKVPWAGPNPLGKLPGSVWDIPSQPLTVPPQLGVDHFAAFPMELPRRIILGWSPPGVCTACGEGRRPEVRKQALSSQGTTLRAPRGTAAMRGAIVRVDDCHPRDVTATITGYACACTPFVPREAPAVVLTDLDTGEPFTAEPARTLKAYDFRNWTPPPTRPAVVVDPFGGTGTTALVAAAYGRHGITIDMSADYCRLAAWRTTDPAQRAAAMQVPKPPPVIEGQATLDLFGATPEQVTA